MHLLASVLLAVLLACVSFRVHVCVIGLMVGCEEAGWRVDQEHRRGRSLEKRSALTRLYPAIFHCEGSENQC